MSEGYGYCPKTMGLVDEPRVAEDLESHGESDALHRAASDPPSGVPYATDVLAEASDLINNGRKTAYGHPIDNFDRIRRGWEVILGIPISRRQVAKCMGWTKIARDCETELTGDQEKMRENSVDLCGYGALMEEV